MRNRAVAAVLFGSVAICCVLIAGLDLAVLSQPTRYDLDEMAPAAVLKSLFTVIPVLKTALFTAGGPSSALVFIGTLSCGAAAALMAVAAVLVRRGKPLGTLLAAVLGGLLIGFSLFGAMVVFDSAFRDGATWYVRTAGTLFGLAALSYVAGLWAIPPHEPSEVSGTVARRAIVTSAIGVAVLAMSYAWYLVAEHFYGWESSLIVVAFAAVAAAGLAVLAWVAARRGGSKGVLVAGGLVVLPYVVLVITLVAMVTGSVLPPLIVGPLFVVPLLVGLVRLVAEPAGTVRADGRAPAALVAASVWAGPVVVLLSVVGIGDARRIAYEEARLKGADNVGDPLVGDAFLDAAAGGVRAYAVLFAVAVVVMTVLARRVRSRGGTPGTQAAVVAWGLSYLVLMAFAVSYTPFAIGDSDEFVHRVVVEGPVWYVPAVRTILVCSIAALVAASVLLVRRPRESMVYGQG